MLTGQGLQNRERTSTPPRLHASRHWWRLLRGNLEAAG